MTPRGLSLREQPRCHRGDLERAISDGKGIEVNRSSFRYGLSDLQPCTEILELYRDLGGRVLTIGADLERSRG